MTSPHHRAHCSTDRNRDRKQHSFFYTFFIVNFCQITSSILTRLILIFLPDGKISECKLFRKIKLRVYCITFKYLKIDSEVFILIKD